MTVDFDIRGVSAQFEPSLAPLLAESEAQGFRFVRRLVDDWRDGSNRFDQPGEALFGSFAEERLVAIGGLNRDPAGRDDVGRVRHVYVCEEFRRRGLARHLVARLVAHARPHFCLIELRTGTPAAAAFYESIGFRRIDAENATHVLRIA